MNPNSTPKTMSIGGATFDLFVRTDNRTIHSCGDMEAFAFPLGEKVRVRDVIETCGGGASNTSVGLARLGCNAHFEGVVGADQWGEKLKKNLEKEGVDTSCITVVEHETSSFSIILSATSGERVILYDPGTNAHLHDVTFDRDMAATMDWVYLNHIQEESCVIQDNLIDIFEIEDSPGLTWNPGGCQIDVGLEAPNNKHLLEHTNLLLVNKDEALAFSKKDSVREAFEVLLEGGVKNVCITDGKKGALATNGKTYWHCPILTKGDVTDTTGAGDAFGTGTTWAILQGEDLPTALKAGTLNAESVVSAIGAQAGLLTEDEMQKRLTEISLEVASISPQDIT